MKLDSVVAMKCILTILALLASSTAIAAAASDVPEGVVYAGTTPEVMASATQRLHTALDTGPDSVAELFGLDDSGSSVKVGAFFAIEIEADNLKMRNLFGKGKYRVANFVGNSEGVVDSYGAANAEQKRLLAYYLFMAADLKDARIRRPTFDELALIWYWIGWDLEDPLLVAESAHDTYVFDFDAKSGHITWVERLTHPCFTGAQETKQVLECHCAQIKREGNRAITTFALAANCPASPAAQARSATSAAKPALPAAHLRVSERTARMDGMLARAFEGEFAIQALPESPAGYKPLGKLLEGHPPTPPKDERGEPIHGYVLLGSVFGADGRAQANRVLLTTGPSATAVVLDAAQSWRVEPAMRGGKPVAEMVWQEIAF